MSHAYYNIRRAFLALTLLLTFTVSQSLAQWVEAPALPQVRNLAMNTILGGKLYVWGGTSTDFNVTSVLPNSASLATGMLLTLPGGPSWTSLSPMPTPRNGGYAAAINGKIYIVGGNYVQGSSINLTSSVLEFEPTTQSYTELEAMPQPVIGPAYATIGTKIYVLGGFSISGSNVNINDVIQEYDVTSGMWTTHTGRLPYAMAYGTATAVGQKIMLVGGVSVQSGSLVYTRNAYMGTVASGAINWTKVADYPVFNTLAASGALNGKVYVAGGENGGGTLNSVYRFDENGGKWDIWYSLPSPVALVHTMSSDGTALYLPGGRDNKNVYRLTSGDPVSVAAIGQTDYYVTTEATSAAKNIAIRLTNNGVAALGGTIVIPVEAQSWLSTQNGTFGNIAAGASSNLIVSVGGPSVAVGNYKATINVTTNDPNRPTIPVTVRLFVREGLTSQPTRVVIEESSGNWCPPCGAYGIPALRAIEAEHGEDVIIVGYHDRGGRPTEPMHTEETEAIGRKLTVDKYGWPSAAIQRWWFPGQPLLVLGSGDWSTAVSAVLAAQPQAPIAMELKSYKYDLLSNKITAKLEFTTTQAMPWSNDYSLRVTAVVTEDSLQYTQEGNSESPFYHMHVARNFWPDINGRELTVPATALHDDGSVLLPGQTFSVDVDFTPDNVRSANRSHVVFFAHIDQGSAVGPILQGLEHKMTESISAGGITFEPGTVVKAIAPNQSTVFESTVRNGGSSPIEITATRTAVQYPEDNWTSQICVADDCAAPEEDSKTTTILPNETKTFRIHVTSGSAGQGKVTLRFTDGADYEVTQEYTVNAAGAGVSIDAVAGNGLRLMQNSPNPAATSTRFGYVLPKASNVMVDVYAINGVKVLSLPGETLEAGAHTLDLDVASLPNGVYTVRLTASGASVSRTITVAR